MLLEDLGLSPADRSMLIKETDVVIHCAASVQIDIHLQDAIRINYYGPLKMLALAHDCVHLQSFTYISTAYVNSNRRHYVEEKIYDMPKN
jgi:fatty acyl-CoA reductase